MSSRRNFLKTSAMIGAGTLLLPRRVWPFVQSPTNLRKFVIGLPGLGSSAANEIGQYIPVATPNTNIYPGFDYYNIQMSQYSELMHPDLPKPTTFWGYSDITGLGDSSNRYLGPLIIGQNARPIRVTYTNTLPNKHILPIDHTLMGAGSGQAQNRAIVHLHGGLVPWTSDGGPFSWSTPSGTQHGKNWQPGDFVYPNNQSARLVWYHDHAMGITRLNAYSGLAAGYLIGDSAEAGLVSSGVIPSIQLPLIIQDKTFVPQNIHQVDKTWKWGEPGDLWYPHQYEAIETPKGINPKGRWDWGPYVQPPSVGTKPLPTPASSVPEAFFDTILINGACYPYANVQPRRYRFRILNGSQARYYNLQLYYADSTGQEANLQAPGPPWIQIGTEGGFLPAPVVSNNPPIPTPYLPDSDDCNPDGPFNLLLAPAERADIIIDFSQVPVGSNLILYSDAPAPFPSGDPRNDYFTGDQDQTAEGGAPTTYPGLGPNTRTLMQFRVVPLVGNPDPWDFATTLAALQTALPNAFSEMQPPLLLGPGQIGSFIPGAGKTLNEDFDDRGRLIQTIGTTDQNGFNNQGLPTWGRGYVAKPVTEVANNGDTQVWNIYNLTGDTHPIHFHLVNVQIVSRAPFDAGTPDFNSIGTPRPPDANELGWKDTVRMNPGEVTTVIMKFNAPKPADWQPWLKFFTSPRTGGYEYVWHCHILEHEEHDMMRPLVVNP